MSINSRKNSGLRYGLDGVLFYWSQWRAVYSSGY